MHALSEAAKMPQYNTNINPLDERHFLPEQTLSSPTSFLPTPCSAIFQIHDATHASARDFEE